MGPTPRSLFLVAGLLLVSLASLVLAVDRSKVHHFAFPDLFP